MIRVAIIPSWFPTDESPLFGSFVLDQARALGSVLEDVEVHVMAPVSAPIWLSLRAPASALAAYWRGVRAPVSVEWDEGAKNLYVHRLPVFQAKSFLNVDGWALNGFLMNRTMRAIEQQYGPIDLVHAHVCYPAGVTAARICSKRPWVLTEHMGPFPFPELLEPDGTLLPKVQHAFRSAAAVVAVSRSHATDIHRYTDVTPVVIPNVCDETAFFPRAERLPGPFRFLFVGGLNEHKGVDVLLQAIVLFVAEGHVATFTIVGDGPLAASLRATSDALGIASFVEWRGSVGRRDLPQVFRSVDAFVLPSRHESFGVVCIEALATGLPVIATRCGGPEDIILPSDGELVESENPRALAGAMRRVLHGSFDSVQIRRDFVRRFARLAIANQLRDLYVSVLRRRE